MSYSPLMPRTDAEWQSYQQHSNDHFGYRMVKITFAAKLEAELAQREQRIAQLEKPWQTGTPDVATGKQVGFWCAVEGCNGGIFHRSLTYCNRHQMPVSDGMEPDANAEPVPNTEEDYYWTGWFEDACDQCDTQWRYSGKVIAWMCLPKFTALATPNQTSNELT